MALPAPSRLLLSSNAFRLASLRLSACLLASWMRALRLSSPFVPCHRSRMVLGSRRIGRRIHRGVRGRSKGSALNNLLPIIFAKEANVRKSVLENVHAALTLADDEKYDGCSKSSGLADLILRISRPRPPTMPASGKAIDPSTSRTTTLEPRTSTHVSDAVVMSMRSASRPLSLVELKHAVPSLKRARL